MDFNMDFLNNPGPSIKGVTKEKYRSYLELTRRSEQLVYWDRLMS